MYRPAGHGLRSAFVTDRILVLPGDGIGPEVTRAAASVLRAVGERFHHDFELESCAIGGAALNTLVRLFWPEIVYERRSYSTERGDRWSSGAGSAGTLLR